MIVAFLAIPMLLSGCTHSSEQVRSHPPGMVTQQQKWVVYGSTGSTLYYTLTNQRVSNAGKMVFDFQGSDVMSQGPAGWGTNDADAMKVYEISGINIHQAVAVQMKDGSYVRANVAGTKKP